MASDQAFIELFRGTHECRLGRSGRVTTLRLWDTVPFCVWVAAHLVESYTDRLAKRRFPEGFQWRWRHGRRPTDRSVRDCSRRFWTKPETSEIP